MGTVAEHVRKADDNAAFGASLDLSTQVNVEWAATALFYSGLHYVEALLQKRHIPQREHRDHGTRNTTIQNHAELTPIYREYMDLYNLSRSARYYCNRITAHRVANDVIPAFEAVKNHIQAAL